MRAISRNPGAISLIALLTLPVSASVLAQQQEAPKPDITVTGTEPAPQPVPDPATMTPGPEVKGIISARNRDRIQITTAEGARTVVALNDATRIKANSGLFSGNRTKPSAASLIAGMPVTVKTLQGSGGLIASQVAFKNGDLRTASMIHNGTDQRFTEQAAATEALRGRMADIDQYNVKSTTNVNFETGKWVLSEQAKTDLCSTASQAESTNNALMLVVGYTDSVGSEEYNQTLSERRAARVINYLQQACRWKPYRMLTPTGMAESDPLGSNDTSEGKAQNRRVSVNILVSKAVDGM
jgi:OmpA-OmpF porin, OOP family